MNDELTEICLTAEDVARLQNEYRIAETQMLQLCVPSTQPLGLLIPFPGGDLSEHQFPRRRDLRPAPRLMPTWRLVSLASGLGAAAAALGSVIW